MIVILVGGVVCPIYRDITIVGGFGNGTGSRVCRIGFGGERKRCGCNRPGVGTSGINGEGLPIVGKTRKKIGLNGVGGLGAGSISGTSLGILTGPTGLRDSLIESLATSGHVDVGTKKNLVTEIVAIVVGGGGFKNGGESYFGGGISRRIESGSIGNVAGGKRVRRDLGGSPGIGT